MRDIAFEIKQGEVVGVIGRNGAGKSTLLKILSRITRPSKGFAEIHGRVGSLLEVGTGFHPELTGRENIYLNGAILGMRHSEIERKFDEIVDFAEIERFLYTAVKHYSTGMFMRLAFSVAAHLDPEILLVDEVLAVGDAEFQKKCLGKMGSVAKQGRTVLFVSHNMPAVQSLCNRCIYLESGRLRCAGSLQEGIAMYHDGSGSAELESSTGEVTVLGTRVNGETAPVLSTASPVRFEFDLAIRALISGFRLFLIIENSQGTQVLHLVENQRELKAIRGPGTYRVSVSLPPLWVTPGIYSFHTKCIYDGVNLKGRYVSDKQMLSFTSNYNPESAPGVLSPPVEWTAVPAERPIAPARNGVPV